MHFFKPKQNNILPLYNKIVFLTRKNFFYKDLLLLDSFSNRIYLIFFHLCFMLITLKNKQINKYYSQSIFDFFFNQIELNLRELGYGDAVVNKKMKRLIKLYYEIFIQCLNWKQLTIENKKVLLLKFFTNNSEYEILTSKLTNYFNQFSLFITNIPLNSLIKGVFNFEYKE